MTGPRVRAAWQQQLQPLLTRIAGQRDPRALEQLYRLTSAPLLGLIMRILRDEGASAEQLQELYLKVWHHADQFGQRGSAWGWLCVMARNAALDRLRADKWPPRQPLDECTELLTAHAAPDSAADWREPAIQRCLQRLQPETRRLILLSYIQGYSHRELQQLSAWPLGSIKSAIRRGLQELKRCLTP